MVEMQQPMTMPPTSTEETETPLRHHRTVCPECDLVCEERLVARGQRGRCPRCLAPLSGAPPGSEQTTLALALTGCVLVVIVNAFPLLALTFQSVRRDTTLFGAALEMWRHDMRLVALLVLLTTVLAPAVQMALHTHVLWQLHAHRDWRALRGPLRLLHRLRPWSMGEVFLLGLLVSLVKVRDQADVILGPAFWACVLLIFITAALNARVDARSVWLWSEHGTGR
jgi:paraquat-inducible protein A